jgi:hypothetical protein
MSIPKIHTLRDFFQGPPLSATESLADKTARVEKKMNGVEEKTKRRQ